MNMMSEVSKAVLKEKKRCNIFRVVDRMYTVPRLLGLCPHVLRQDSFRISCRLLFFTLSHVTLTVFFGFYFGYAVRSGDLRNFVFQCLVKANISFYLLSPFAVVCPVFKLHHLNLSLSNISLVDSCLKRMGYNCERQANKNLRIGRCVHWSLCFANIFVIIKAVSFKYSHKVLILLWPNILTTIVLEQIISLLRVHRVRMDAIITAAKDIVSFSSKLNNLEELVRCHSLLCKSGSLLNDVYTSTFLLMCTCSFTVTVCNLYFIYCYFYLNQFNVSTISFYFNWVAIESTIFLRLISNCAVSSAKAEEFNTLLYQLMLDAKSNTLIHNPKLRLHIAMKRNITFTAYGFFTLDYTLIHTIIAAATTYLVILVQFDLPTNDPVEMNNVTTTPFVGLITTQHE